MFWWADDAEIMQCFDHELTEKLIPGGSHVFVFVFVGLLFPTTLIAVGNVNKSIDGSKNTVNLKIIDQIYYFRYALLQSFKGTRKNSN